MYQSRTDISVKFCRGRSLLSFSAFVCSSDFNIKWWIVRVCVLAAVCCWHPARSQFLRQWHQRTWSPLQNYKIWCFIRYVGKVVDLAFNLYLHVAYDCDYSSWHDIIFHGVDSITKWTPRRPPHALVGGGRWFVYHRRNLFCFPNCLVLRPKLSHSLTLVSRPRITFANIVSKYFTSSFFYNVSQSPINTLQHSTGASAWRPRIDTTWNYKDARRLHSEERTQTSMTTKKIQMHRQSFWTERVMRMKLTRYNRRWSERKLQRWPMANQKSTISSWAIAKSNRCLPHRSPAQRSSWSPKKSKRLWRIHWTPFCNAPMKKREQEFVLLLIFSLSKYLSTCCTGSQWTRFSTEKSQNSSRPPMPSTRL